MDFFFFFSAFRSLKQCETLGSPACPPFLRRKIKDAIKSDSFLSLSGRLSLFFFKCSRATIPLSSFNQLLVFVLIAWVGCVSFLACHNAKHNSLEKIILPLSIWPVSSNAALRYLLEEFCLPGFFTWEPAELYGFSFEKDLKTVFHMWGWPLSVVVAHLVCFVECTYPCNCGWRREGMTS